MIGPISSADWWTAIHLVLFDTAERIGAAIGLKWSDIDLSGRWLHVRAETRKGRTRDRVMRLHPETVRALKKIRDPERESVFPWPWDPGSLWMMYGQLLVRAGLPADRKSKFHRMRKSVASHYKAAGGNPQDLLDHSSWKVTKTYLDPRIAKQPQVSDVLFRP